ncbi:hypothetical protein QFZ77_006400 [Paenibacillus sp. V4I3]|uniref:hypothetical protein n=1 Tax=unclassified Paenibacillus TaxID=185978 RepID=UPI00277DE98E|nr:MULTISPECIES: hypothetical protein [unclassified Paenibacillus]MDQ0877741.1 hypothetical protein [Paenibacillus sp. V4I3]MDQ0886384.1 hypothetical protein [Paenibacillus sp. V4I9]
MSPSFPLEAGFPAAELSAVAVLPNARSVGSPNTLKSLIPALTPLGSPVTVILKWLPETPSEETRLWTVFF